MNPKKKIPFSKLPIRKRRLMVLKDALKMVMANLIKPEKGVVIALDFNLGSNDQQLQPILKKLFKNRQNCRVCLRGGLLCALIVKNNSFTVGQMETTGTFSHVEQQFNRDGNSITETVAGDHNTDRRMSSLWTIKSKQLAMMETAFEGKP